MEHDIKNTTGSYSTEQWIANVENKVFELQKQIKELQEQKESKQILKFKKTHESSITPVKANETDMCYDLFAVDDGKLSEMFIEYDTGIAFDIPEGYDVKVFPRSSISKYDLVLANGTGIIDNGYKDSVKCRFKILYSHSGIIDESLHRVISDLKLYKKGDRIAQFTLVKKVNYKLEETDSLSNSERGLSGFGSSGV